MTLGSPRNSGYSPRLKIINFITSAKSRLLDKVTHSQVQGLGSIFFRGEGKGHFSANHSGPGELGSLPHGPCRIPLEGLPPFTSGVWKARHGAGPWG